MNVQNSGLVAVLVSTSLALGACASAGGAGGARSMNLEVDQSVTEVVVRASELFEELGYREVGSMVTPNLQNYGAVTGRRQDGGTMKVNVRSVDGPAEIVVASSDPRDIDAEARIYAALAAVLDVRSPEADTASRVALPAVRGGVGG